MDRRSALAAVILGAIGNASRAEESGPYCWAGKQDGINKYIPCPQTSPPAKKSILLDLTAIDTIKIVSRQKTIELNCSEIIRVLEV